MRIIHFNRTKGALGSIGHEYSVSSDDAALLSQWSVFFGELVVARELLINVKNGHFEILKKKLKKLFLKIRRYNIQSKIRVLEG
ncbi:unnamed protein product [Rhizophagus irregularis]|nr:unnamed protein product [Rhizophagus irregularis]